MAQHARGVRLGLVSATLAEASTRRSRFAAALLRDAYRVLFASPLDPDVVEDVRMATRRGTAPAVEAQRRAQMSHAADPRFGGESEAVVELVETYRTGSVALAGL